MDARKHIGGEWVDLGDHLCFIFFAAVEYHGEMGEEEGFGDMGKVRSKHFWGNE